MKAIVNKKFILIAFIILYIVALPLFFHVSGIFKSKDVPDLKKFIGSQVRYSNMSKLEKEELLSEVGFNLNAFAEGGFDFILENMQVFVFDDESAKIHSIRMQTFKEETYLISITIYAFEAEQSSTGFMPQYKRREINEKAVGFFEPNESASQSPKARYYNEKTGYVYYIEPAFEFKEPDYSFLAILVR